jgi:MshEN domain
LPKTLAAGLLGRGEAARAGRLAEQRGEPLVVVLVRELGVDEVALVGAIRRQTRAPMADPGEVRPHPAALAELQGDVCRRLRVLPLSLTVDGAGVRVLRLATADPTDRAAIAEVEHLTGCEVDAVLLPLSAVEELVEEGYRVAGLVTPRIGRRRRFGEDLAPTTQLHERHERPASEETIEVPATMPFHVVSDEADAGLRVRALVGLLVAKGVISEEEYEEAVKDLMKRRSEEP